MNEVPERMSPAEKRTLPNHEVRLRFLKGKGLTRQRRALSGKLLQMANGAVYD
jgi:hypothetical protein